MMFTDMPKDTLTVTIFITLVILAAVVMTSIHDPEFGLFVVCIAALLALSWIIATILKRLQ